MHYEFYINRFLHFPEETVSVERIMTDYYKSRLFTDFIEFSNYWPDMVEDNTGNIIVMFRKWSFEKMKAKPSSKDMYYYLSKLSAHKFMYIMYMYWNDYPKDIIDMLAQKEISVKQIYLFTELWDIYGSEETEDVLRKEFLPNITVKKYNELIQRFIHKKSEKNS